MFSAGEAVGREIARSHVCFSGDEDEKSRVFCRRYSGASFTGFVLVFSCIKLIPFSEI